MAKKNNGDIRDTIAAIDFIRATKSQSPSDNKILFDLLTEDEQVLLERLYQLFKQDKSPIQDELEQAPLNRKSRGKEVMENGNSSRRAD